MKTKSTLHLTILSIIILIVLIWRSDGILKGEYLLPLDSLWLSDPWKKHMPDEATGVRNMVLTDVPHQFYPWFVHARSRFLSGTIPLWNPYSYCGTPFLANPQKQVFHPLHLLFRLWPDPMLGFSVIIIFRFLLSGIFMYLLLQHLHVSPMGRYIFSLVYALGGPITVWSCHTLGDVIYCLPLLMYTTGSFIEKPCRANILGVTLAVSLTFLSGHIESVALITPFVIVFSLLKIWEKRSVLLKKSGYLLLGVILGIGMILIVYLPFAEYLKESIQYDVRRQFTNVHGFLPKSSASLLFFPFGYGSPVNPHHYIGPQNFNEVSGYMGIGTIALSFVSLFSRKKWVLIFLLFIIISFGIVYEFSGFPAFASIIPLWKLCWMNRLLLVLSFSITVLAAIGFESILESKKIRIVPVIIYQCCVLTFFYILFNSPASKVPFIKNHMIFYLMLSLAFSFILIIPWQKKEIALGLLLIAEVAYFGKDYIPTVTADECYPDTRELNLLAKYQGDGRIAASRPVLPPDTHLCYGLRSCDGYDCIIPKYIDMLLQRIRKYPQNRFQSHYANYSSPVWDFLTVTTLISDTPPISSKSTPWLKSEEKYSLDIRHFGSCTGLRMISALDGPSASEDGSLIGVLTVQFSSGKARRFEILRGVHTDVHMGGKAPLHRIVYGDQGKQYCIYQAEYSWNTNEYPEIVHIELLRTSYHFAIDFFEPIGGRWKPLNHDTPYVYLNTRVKPLFELLSFRDSDDVISNSIPAENRLREKLESPNGSGSINVSEQSDHEITISVSADESGALVIRQTDFPGWIAFVDKQAVNIQRTENAFMGVPILSNNHVLLLRYRPISFLLGAFFLCLSISIFSIIFINFPEN
ncbi:YfhO family protein [bacterium]|nr:YfhO family protein [candidate division CSSED10-310 bacterium]